MRKFLMFLCAVTLVVGMVGTASAIPIEFDIDGSNSEVTISNVSSSGFWGSSSVAAELATGLDSEEFFLDNGDSYTFDFFNITIEAEGFLSWGTADIEAILAFTLPSVTGITGTGSGGWLTIGGQLSAGELTWLDMPQTLSLSNGDYFDVDFSDISGFGFGNSATVTATLTAHAGPDSAAPVPEPSTMLLMGSGILGLVAYGCKRRKKV